MAESVKLLYYIPALGEQGVVPPGSVVDIGGIVGPDFLVDGRPLVFADGTTTSGGIAFIQASNVFADTTNLAPVGGVNVQAALESIALAINNIDGGAATAVRGYEHVQSVAADTWIVNHNLNSRKVQISIWDSVDELVLADVVAIVNANQVTIKYNTPITGRAILMVF